MYVYRGGAIILQYCNIRIASFLSANIIYRNGKVFSYCNYIIVTI